MRSLSYLLILFLISCGSPDPETQKQFVQGYWEIQAVEMSDGNKKEFSVNTSIDYIKVEGDGGSRKKLMPQLDGSFKEFPTVERFEFEVVNNDLLMNYQPRTLSGQKP